MNEIAKPALGRGIRRWVTLLSALGLLVALMVGLASQVHGAEDNQTRIKNFKISVWPEYDEPRVLVMYEGEFDDKASFPKVVKFRLPKDAEIGQVCALSEKKEHLCQLYEVTRGEDLIEVTYTLPIPTFFIEYYYSPVTDGPRNIAFNYANVYGADKMNVEVQQPLRATDFSLSPNPLTTASDNQGFKYSQLAFDNVRPEQKLDLKIAYNKTDKTPSVAKKQTGGAPSTGPGIDNNNVLIVIVVAAVLAGVVYVGLGRRQQRPYAPQPVRSQSRSVTATGGSGTGVSATRPNPRHASQPPKSQKAKVQQGPAFCAGCGTPLEPGDRFCSSCGKKSKAAM